MTPDRVREAGFAKDADKLIRRLSLVALLLARGGQPVSADQIRECVEGYPLMTDDAFKRRFYEDRAELARLGIAISTEPAVEGDGDLYRLPADAYYLPPIELDAEELAALAACLHVLEDHFSYSQPLRLALLSLAQGRPEVLTEAAAPALTVLPEAGHAAGAAALAQLQNAIADRKTVRFNYYTVSRDEMLARTVDPYGLQLVAGEWYLIGRCHLRESLRTFRLSRIRSRVTHATRAPHDFEIPADFDLRTFRDRPPWQLATSRGRATIRISAALAWWVQAHWSHCGTITADDDGIIYVTDYAEARPLLSWVLGMGEAAHLDEPQELRDSLVGQLELLLRALDEPPKPAAGAGSPPTATAARENPLTRSITVDRFTRLTTLATYLLRRCPGDDETILHVPTVCADLSTTADDLRADIRLLNLVNFGADGALLYAEIEAHDELHVSRDLAGAAFARPPRLSPLQADTLLLAGELLDGQTPDGGAALTRALTKIRTVRGAAPSTLASSDLLPPDERLLNTISAAIRQRQPLRIEYWAEGTARQSERVVEPYLLLRNRGEWYYVCWCRRAQDTRVFRVATTKAATALDEVFAPRPEVELELYRRDGIPTSQSYAPQSALLWYSATIRPWIAERQPVQELDDGSCLATQPFVDQDWLTHYLLRFGGHAVPQEPREARDALRRALAGLLRSYQTP
ncbi:MAG: WYL domain-containing protein [Thermoleophilia bacterium]